MTNRINKWIRKRRERLIEEYGGECYNIYCKKNDDLEFAHIKDTELNGRGRGRKERVYDAINNPSSYILLCNDCHTRFDNGETLKLKKG